MGKKKQEPSRGFSLVVEKVPVLDTDERLRRAFDLVVKAAARIGTEASPVEDGNDEEVAGVS